MKMKTKILVMLISIMVVGMTMNVFGADKITMTASVSGDTAKNGEITVKLDVAGNANLGGMQAQLTYDKSKLEYVSGKLTDGFKTSAEAAATDVVNSDTGVGIAVVFNEPSNYNGTIAELKFRVLADGGDTVEIGLTSEMADINYNEMTVENKAANFTVKVPMAAISIEGDAERALQKGETAALTVKVSPENTTETNKKVNWTSSDEKVATVDANGVVTAVGGGKAVITATTQVGALTAQTSITVNVKLTGISISAPASSVEEGKTLQLKVAVVPEDATEKVENTAWSSSDESIAKVDNNGTVTAVKAGKVKITAKAAGFTKEIEINVTEAKVEQQPTEQQPTEQPTNTDEVSKTEDSTAAEGSTGVAGDDTVNTGDPVQTEIFVMLMLLSIGGFCIAMLGKKSAV